jgi:hypothetical protein
MSSINYAKYITSVNEARDTVVDWLICGLVDWGKAGRGGSAGVGIWKLEIGNWDD